MALQSSSRYADCLLKMTTTPPAHIQVTRGLRRMHAACKQFCCREQSGFPHTRQSQHVHL